MILAILLLAGLFMVLKNDALKADFKIWFRNLGLGILAFYLLLDPGQFRSWENIVGMAFLAFLLAMLVVIIRKR